MSSSSSSAINIPRRKRRQHFHRLPDHGHGHGTAPHPHPHAHTHNTHDHDHEQDRDTDETEQHDRLAVDSPVTLSHFSMSGRSSYGSVDSEDNARSPGMGKAPATRSAGKLAAFVVPKTTAAVPSPVANHQTWDRRRSSFLSESLARSEYTIVDIGSEDNPRLITCVKASQGFDWNQELFLPSYMDYDFESLERRQEPVKDIIVTDEEAAAYFPQ